MARRLHIKIIEATNLINLDVDGQLDPYVMLRLKNQDKRDFEMTEVKNDTTDPVWNQQFNILAVDPNDVLLINIYNKCIKKDEKLIEELQFPVNMFQILAPVERKEIDLKLKRKKNLLSAGRLVFEIQAYPPEESKPRDPNVEVDHVVLTEGCKIHIKCFEAKDVIKMGLGAKPDPYLRFKVKDFVVKSQVATKTTSPVWNEELDIISTNPEKDILEVDLVDNDLNKNELMMNTISIPISEHPYGDHYVFDDFIKLKKKNAGKLHFELSFSKVKEMYVHTVNSHQPAKVEQPKPAVEEPVQAEEPVAPKPVEAELIKPVEEPIEAPVEKPAEPSVEATPEPVEPAEEKPVEAPIEEVHEEVVEPPKPAEEEQEKPVVEENVEQPVKEEPVQTREVQVEQKPQEPTNPCKLFVKVVKCENLVKNDADSFKPLVSVHIKDDQDSLQKTKIVENDVNPVWNQQFEFNIKDHDTAILLVNLYDGEVQDDTKLMNEISFPLKEWGIGTHIEYTQDINLDKKGAGKIYLEFDVRNDNEEVGNGKSVFELSGHKPFKTGESVKGVIVGANKLPKTNSNGADTYVVLTIVSPADKDRKSDKVKTGVNHNTQDPVWNKNFDFRYLQDGDLLRAEVYQSHKIVGDQCIAYTEIPIKCFEENKQIQQTYKLEKPAKVPKSVKKVTDFGTITLNVTHSVEYH